MELGAQPMNCDGDEPHFHPDLPADEWRAQVEHALQVTGHRNTAPRRAVLDWIAAQTGPFTAETLVADLGTHAATPGRATIYRIVDWLRAAGWIARVHSDTHASSYTRLLPGHHHSVVCLRCGLTLMVGGCAVEQLVAPALADTGFEVHGHVLELYGVCGTCRGRGS
jgi:Fur family transcriptional regulator, ferric uptake regulator